LADACLQYALEVILRKHQLKKCPLAIVGLGKLGGQELSYGSDLDIVFVSSAPARELPRWQRVAAEVMDLLSAPTEQGLVFPTDARLRPDGEKGLLVNTFDAYEDYYRRRAQLWEIQAISRSRAAAGDAELGRRFVELTARLSDFSTSNVAAGFTSRRDGAAEKRPPGERKPAAASKDAPRSGLAAYRPDWKQTIAHMRQRIEKERTVPGQEALAFKTGAGGLVDAEFIAQALCLAYGWHEPNTLRALERARDAGALARADAEALIASTRQLRRLECILRRWSFEGESVLPTDPAPYYRVSVRCGFPSPEAFRDTLAAWRSVIREVYGKVLNG
jgi:glutamate-ammonia-ligase adenylyltransferase